MRPLFIGKFNQVNWINLKAQLYVWIEEFNAALLTFFIQYNLEANILCDNLDYIYIR